MFAGVVIAFIYKKTIIILFFSAKKAFQIDFSIFSIQTSRPSVSLFYLESEIKITFIFFSVTNQGKCTLNQS